jgi:hypothetical protein
VIVPAISRVMHFGLVGEPEVPFWQNRELNGQLPTPGGTDWINFGGDKCWPAPQSAWPERSGRGWPPPLAFDARPAHAAVVEQGVVLTSTVDPDYGIQVLRTVELDSTQPVMRIISQFRKVEGPPVEVSIWTITQLREPESILLRLPERSAFPKGFLHLLDAKPKEINQQGNTLSFKRHPSLYTKIGSDAVSMAWLGKNCTLRIDAESGPGQYPDGGCLTEVYTNPDPMRYVELETLGPLEKIRSGEVIGRTTRYTLRTRWSTNVNTEAESVFD